ncbi:MAG TPA: (d)CMP kinase [Acidimicrobiia bacterium]|nr:(d)CMP kinase [Acidimicrobiia bacterium]
MTSGSARIIAIDGPSGAGKSTVARGVAAALGLEVLDTGAMYRAVTWAVLEQGLDPSDEEACAAVARSVAVEVGERVLVDDRDVSDEIRGPAVTGAVSRVSAHPSVRSELVARQREWVRRHDGGVVEGRDIGTVVFPDTPVKVFLTASDEERARRRQRDEAGAARPVDLEEVRKSLSSRDHLDSTRSSSPLVQADDALVLDTTTMSADDAIAAIVARAREALA